MIVLGLRSRLSTCCARHRSGSRPLETAFRLRHALRLLADPGDPAVDGTIEEHLAHL
jgi:hypothetical protein